MDDKVFVFSKSSTLKQFVGKLPTNYMFEYFVGLALKGLIFSKLNPFTKREIPMQYVMLCRIWYHLYNLENLRNTHGGGLLLVKLQTSVCNFIKVTLIYS